MKQVDEFDQWLSLECLRTKLHCKMYILLLVEDGLQQLRRIDKPDQPPALREVDLTRLKERL